MNIICVIVLIIFVICTVIKCGIEYFKKDIKIAILVIDSTHMVSSTKRNHIEKANWERQMPKKPDNIDVFYLQAGNENKIIQNMTGSYTLSTNDQESYVPGIYQKTLNGLNHEKLANYDFYVRTNLSTFINFNHLLTNLNKLDKSKPLYTGPVLVSRKWGTSFVSGTCIILNNTAKNMLTRHGLQDKYYNTTSFADDVLIANVLRDNGIKPVNNKELMYWWKWTANIESNYRNITKQLYPFIRLRVVNKSLSYLREVLEFLHNKY